MGRRPDRAIGAAVQFARIPRAAAEREIERQTVRGPSGEGALRRVGQHAGAVRSDRAAVEHLGVHDGVAGADRPVRAQPADGVDLHTLHAFLADLVVLGRIGLVLHQLVVDGGAVYRAGQQQPVAEQVPLGADFDGASLLRVEVGPVLAAGRTAEGQRIAARRILRHAEVGIDAAVGTRLAPHAELVAVQVVVLALIDTRDNAAGWQRAACGRVAGTTDDRAGVVGAVVVQS